MIKWDYANCIYSSDIIKNKKGVIVFDPSHGSFIAAIDDRIGNSSFEIGVFNTLQQATKECQKYLNEKVKKVVNREQAA